MEQIDARWMVHAKGGSQAVEGSVQQTELVNHSKRAGMIRPESIVISPQCGQQRLDHLEEVCFTRGTKFSAAEFMQ